MSKKTKQNIAIAIVSAVLCFGLIVIVTNCTKNDTQVPQDEFSNEIMESEIMESESTPIESTVDESTDSIDNSNTYLDVGYEKDIEDTASTDLTEADLAVNEFLVNAIIFTYTGDDNYEITKGVSDADLVITKDDSSEQVNCHIEVTSTDIHKDTLSAIIEKGNEYVDINGTYFYFDVDANTKTVVSIKYKKYITIQCDDASIFDALDVRSSELDCC